MKKKEAEDKELERQKAALDKSRFACLGLYMVLPDSCPVYMCGWRGAASRPLLLR